VRVTKFTHSCIRVDGPGVLVVDPGVFSDPGALTGADAVLITHEHPDHLDPDRLAEAHRANPSLVVHAHPQVLPRLAALGDAVTAVEPGQAFTAAGLDVTAYGGQHAVIHPDIPLVANLAFLISDSTMSVYHPGDSFEVPDVSVDVLFAPISAPWLKISESIDFVRAVKPGRVFALHDGFTTEAGARLVDTHLTNLSGSGYRRLAPGTGID
jgi:L-ascorbate metabolism protein UlaG (beta-lactamase superfamily)